MSLLVSSLQDDNIDVLCRHGRVLKALTAWLGFQCFIKILPAHDSPTLLQPIITHHSSQKSSPGALMSNHKSCKSYPAQQAAPHRSMRASNVMGCTLSVVRLTSSSVPLLENLGTQIRRTRCPCGPAAHNAAAAIHTSPTPLRILHSSFIRTAQAACDVCLQESLRYARHEVTSSRTHSTESSSKTHFLEVCTLLRCHVAAEGRSTQSRRAHPRPGAWQRRAGCRQRARAARRPG